MKSFISLGLVCSTLITANNALATDNVFAPDNALVTDKTSSAKWVETRFQGEQKRTRTLSLQPELYVKDRYIIELTSAPVMTAMRREINALRNISQMAAQQKVAYAQDIKRQRLAVKSYQVALQQEQQHVLATLAKQKVSVKLLSQTHNVLNALEIEVSASEVAAIKALAGVKAVHPVTRVQKYLTESAPLISADKVWQETDGEGNLITGQGISVAVIDTGVDYSHPDLGGCLGSGCKVTSGYDFVENDSDPMDGEGHGTHVAGIIAANGTLQGVAPDAQLMAVRVLDNNGEGYNSDVIKGVEFAVDPDNDPTTDDGADVINMSLGGPGDAEDLLSQVVDNATAAGVTVVVAAGNEGLYKEIQHHSPASAKTAITVGSSDKNGNISSYSSRGSYISNKPEVVAPGERINSLAIGGEYIKLSGTSMASPHVAGAAALLLQSNPELAPADIKQRLMSTAVDLGEDPYSQGYGQIDVLAALNAEFTVSAKQFALGRLDISQSTLSFEAELSVANLTANGLELAITMPDGLPSNVSISGVESAINLPGSGTQVVPVTITVTGVENMVDAEHYLGLYFDNLQIKSGNQTANVPVSFEKNYVFNLSNPTDAYISATIDDNKGNDILWDTLAPHTSRQVYGINQTFAIRLRYSRIESYMVPGVTLPEINPENNLVLRGYEEFIVEMTEDKMLAGDLFRLQQPVGLGEVSDKNGNSLISHHQTATSDLSASVSFKPDENGTEYQVGYHSTTWYLGKGTHYLLVGHLTDEFDTRFSQFETFPNSGANPLHLHHYQRLNASQNEGKLWSFQQGSTPSVLVDVDDTIKRLDSDLKVSLNGSLRNNVRSDNATMEYSVLSEGDDTLRPTFYASSDGEYIASITPARALADYSRISISSDAAYYSGALQQRSQELVDYFADTPYATMHQGKLFSSANGQIQFSCYDNKSDWLAYDSDWAHRKFDLSDFNYAECVGIAGQIQFEHFLATKPYTSTVDFSFNNTKWRAKTPGLTLSVMQNGEVAMAGLPLQGNITLDARLDDDSDSGATIDEVSWQLGEDAEWQTLALPDKDDEGIYAISIPRYKDAHKVVSVKLTYSSEDASVTQTLNGMFLYGLDTSDTGDIDGDGILNKDDADIDGDGVLNISDAFPFDSYESVDTDQDGIGNNTDSDDDGDDVADADDAFPLDPDEALDTDLDGIGNNADNDDDGDGIVDEDDSAPLDSTVGDNQAPVIAEIPSQTIEATGPLTALELTEPDVTDNNLNAPTVVSDYDGPLPLGRHEIVWTATDFAGNQAQRVQLVTLVDTTAPVFDELTAIRLDAKGLYTKIPPNLTVKASDLVDGDISVSVADDARYRSGLHQVTVNAEDASGNQVTSAIEVAILPQVQLAHTSKIMAGQSYRAKIQLSGAAPYYPVHIGYELNGDATETGTGELVIESGTLGEVEFTVAEDAKAGDTIELTVFNADNAVVSANNSYKAHVTEQNQAPKVTLQVMQAGKRVSVVDQNAGTATILAKVKDINANEALAYTWQSDDSGLVDIQQDSLTETFEFESAEMSPGSYSVTLSVKETQTQEAYEVELTQLISVQSLAPLSSSTDSDADGVSDSDEGYTDSDGDGIADYLDNDDNVSVLPLSQGRDIQVASGQSLALGQYSQALNTGDRQSAQLTEDDLAQLTDNPELLNDGGYYLDSELLDFSVSGLTELGESAAIVVRVQPLPEGSEYRKFSPQQGWRTFSEDARNTLSSAAVLADSNCPAPMSELYTAGLTAGDECVQLLIEDGGSNDDDGKANGIVQDPGAIALLNHAPSLELVAHNGTVNEGKTMSLNVEASDSDGDSLTYSWVQLSGPTVALIDSDTASVSFTAPEVEGDQVLEFEVTVSDGALNSTLTTEVTVKNQVTTTPDPVKPVESSGSGGGGSFGIWMLMVLGFIVSWRSAAGYREKQLAA